MLWKRSSFNEVNYLHLKVFLISSLMATKVGVQMAKIRRASSSFSLSIGYLAPAFAYHNFLQQAMKTDNDTNANFISGAKRDRGGFLGYNNSFASITLMTVFILFYFSSQISNLF